MKRAHGVLQSCEITNKSNQGVYEEKRKKNILCGCKGGFDTMNQHGEKNNHYFSSFKF